MAVIEIDFEWTRGRVFALKAAARPTAPRTLAHGSPPGALIVQTDAAVDSFQPLSINPTLYLQLAQLDSSPASSLAFARNWGFLLKRAGKGVREDADTWADYIASIKASVAAAEKGEFDSLRAAVKVANVEAILRPSGDQMLPRIALRPKTLMDAIWLQFAQSLSGGKSLRTCRQCSTWFEVGAGGRRTIAEFCSPTCRQSFHNSRR
jgi:hypothetical protein